MKPKNLVTSRDSQTYCNRFYDDEGPGLGAVVSTLRINRMPGLGALVSTLCMLLLARTDSGRCQDIECENCQAELAKENLVFEY